MSNERCRILVVAQTAALGRNLFGWLTDAGHELTVVTTFSAAKTHLRTLPDLLITELKLREYNGLHLAVRAQDDGVPVAVIGHADPVLEHDAHELGAAYVVADQITRRDILTLVETLLSDTRLAEARDQFAESGTERVDPDLSLLSEGYGLTWPLASQRSSAGKTVVH